MTRSTGKTLPLTLFAAVLLLTGLAAACSPSTPAAAPVPSSPGVPASSEPASGEPETPGPTATAGEPAVIEPPAAQAEALPEPLPPVPTLPPGAHPLYGLALASSDGLWMVDAQGEPRRLANQTYARLSPDGKQALFAREEPAGGKTDVFLLDLATGQERNLTNTPDRYEEEPAWWPNRPDQVFFVSDVEGMMASRAFPSLVGVDGSGYTVLDEQNGGPYAISPGGAQLAYGGYNGTAYLYRPGEDIVSFNPAAYGIPVTGLLQPAWSPDGRSLAFQASGESLSGGAPQRGLAVFDLEAGTGMLLHNYQPLGGGGAPAELAWSPAGAWLAFTTQGEKAEFGREPALWLIRPDGTEELLVGPGADPTWSPDGQKLAFLRPGPDGFPQVWLAEAGTWEPKAVALSMPNPVLLIMDWIRPAQ